MLTQILEHSLSFFIKQSISMIFNILLILGITFISIFLSRETSIFWIASIYSSTILYGLYNLSKFKYKDIHNILFVYKLNIKKFISNQVYQETYKQAKKQIYYEAKKEAESKISNLGFFESIMNNFFGEDSEAIASKIANNSAPEVAKKTVENVLLKTALWFVWFIVSVIVYIFIFRLAVAPILIENITNLTSIEAFLYPFFFSLDYFTNTNLLIYLI